jgi:hypothetical protein
MCAACVLCGDTVTKAMEKIASLPQMSALLSALLPLLSALPVCRCSHTYTHSVNMLESLPLPPVTVCMSVWSLAVSVLLSIYASVSVCASVCMCACAVSRCVSPSVCVYLLPLLCTCVCLVHTSSSLCRSVPRLKASVYQCSRSACLALSLSLSFSLSLSV